MTQLDCTPLTALKTIKPCVSGAIQAIDTIDTIYFGNSTHSWLFLAYRQNKHKTKMQGFFHTYSTNIQSKRSMITKRRDENNVMVDGTPHSPVASVLLRARLKHVPPWPSGLKRWNQSLVPVVRTRFKPRCGRPHFAPTRSGVCVCGSYRTEAREREWAEGTVSSLPGTLNSRIKFCHSTGIAR